VLILRLFLILLTLVLLSSVAVYLYTRNFYYLKLAWQLLRFSIFLLLLFAVLFVLERYVLTGWQALL
jgi:hypothetical protein